MSKLDLNLLLALRVLLAEKNVTRAAEALHLTQPAVSGILTRLRTHYGDPLITQIGRKARLTPFASELVGPLDDLLVRLESTVINRAPFDPVRSRRHFKVIAPEYISIFVLGRVTRRIASEAPGVSLEVGIPTGTPAQELEGGDSDCVVTLDPYASPTHPKVDLITDVDAVLVDAGNSRVGDRISLEEFLSLGHVLFQGSQRGLSPFARWYEDRYGCMRRVEIIVDTHHMVPHFLVGTDRVAVMSSRLAQQYADSMPLRLVQTEFEVRRSLSVMQWNRHRDQDPGSRWFRALVVEEAKAVPKAM